MKLGKNYHWGIYSVFDVLLIPMNENFLERNRYINTKKIQKINKIGNFFFVLFQIFYLLLGLPDQLTQKTLHEKNLERMPLPMVETATLYLPRLKFYNDSKK